MGIVDRLIYGCQGLGLPVSRCCQEGIIGRGPKRSEGMVPSFCLPHCSTEKCGPLMPNRNTEALLWLGDSAH